MTSPQKKTSQKQPIPTPKNTIVIQGGKTPEETLKNLAKIPIDPNICAYRVIAAAEGKSGIGKDSDVQSLITLLDENAKDVKSGDLGHVEAMLTGQATALQSIFTRLVEHGLNQSYVSNYELMLKLALRAQSQCRATLETLAAIKNPPVRINAGQANVSNGPQQVNNVAKQNDLPENQKHQNKLLEEHDVQWLDPRAKGKAGEGNSEMGTMVKVDRAKNRSGKTKSIP